MPWEGLVKPVMIMEEEKIIDSIAVLSRALEVLNLGNQVEKAEIVADKIIELVKKIK